MPVAGAVVVGLCWLARFVWWVSGYGDRSGGGVVVLLGVLLIVVGSLLSMGYTLLEFVVPGGEKYLVGGAGGLVPGGYWLGKCGLG